MQSNLADEQPQSSRWVNAEIDNPKIFEFPSGVAGFTYAKQYVFLAGAGNVACMHCTDHPEAAFVVTDWDENRLGKPPALRPEERALLELETNQEPLWLLVLNPFSDPEWIYANLKAPIAINELRQRGVQCVQISDDLQLRYHWMHHPNKLQD